MLFREHKGSLDESLKTEIRFYSTSKAMLVEYINGLLAMYGHQEFKAEDVIVEFYCKDDRLPSYKDTYIVRAEGYGVLGFTNAMPT